RRSLARDREGELLRKAFTRARGTDTFAEAEATAQELRYAVDAAGFAPSRRTLVALVTRFLQLCTPPSLDALVTALIDRRESLARDLALRPASEAFAYHVSTVPALRNRIDALLFAIGQNAPSEHQRF